METQPFQKVPEKGRIGLEPQRFSLSLGYIRVSLIAQLVKTPPAMQETLVQFLGPEDPLEKG